MNRIDSVNIGDTQAGETVLIFLFYLVASILAWYGAILIYNFASLSVGLLCGAKPVRLSVGFGPVMFAFYDRGIEYSFTWIPLGGYVKFEIDNDLDAERLEEHSLDPECPPRTFQSLHPFSFLLMASSGPVSSLVTGMLIAILAMQFPDSDLKLVPGESSNLPASGVPHLVLTNQRATWETYTHLVTEGVVPFWGKLLTFQAVPGWGGYVGMLTTCTSAGTKSPSAWATCIAILFIAHGLLNCLPIPTLVGWSMLRSTIEIILGRSLPDDPAWIYFTGMAWLLLSMARLLLNDLFWGLGLLAGG